jgi:hypothetical protein
MNNQIESGLRGRPTPRTPALRFRWLLPAAISTVLFVLVLLLGLVVGCGTPTTVSGDQAFAAAFEQHQNGVEVSGEGTVVRVLSDDESGSRHQRFIVALASGQTLLITHNIDVAPRIPGLEAGDRVEFSGVYEWNDEGGVVHWTHHDPDGFHRPGWIEHEGTVYE